MMNPLNHMLVTHGGERYLSIFVPGEPLPLVAAESGHPNFAELLSAAQEGRADDVTRLYDVSASVAERFENLSDRVIVGSGRVLFDGAEVHSSVTKQIVRYLDEGRDFTHLVAFMENVAQNENEHSKAQLFDWLSHRDFTITPDGMIVAYKGVESDGQGGFRSRTSGSEPVYVTVDGETKVHTGKIPNPIGAAVSMDRNLVQHDPSVGCHVGLHAGTWQYASSYSAGAVLEVHIHPRDVVSVPTEVTSYDPTSSAKVRTCRYTVVQTIDAPYSEAGLDVDGVEPETNQPFRVGDRVVDPDGDHGEVARIDEDGDVWVRGDYGPICWPPDDLTLESEVDDDDEDEDWDF